MRNLSTRIRARGPIDSILGAHMYGLVNKAIQDFTIRNAGEAAWANIVKRAGVDVGEFISMSPYDDAITYALVDAASAELNAPASALLEGFGEFWITFTAREGYGELMELWGSSFVEFIEHLNELHARLRFSFPELRPPRISCEKLGPGKLRIEYRSEREGLSGFVVGLLRGLGKRFDLEVTVTHEYGRETHDHDAFIVEYVAAP